jgi:DNA-binding XRE family transcriptional regulator
MKNKRILFLAIAILSSVELLWKSQSRTRLTNNLASKVAPTTTQTILKKDQERLERNLKPETLRDEHWAQVNDYAVDVKKLLNKNNANHFFKLSNGSIASLASCLKKDFCGMEKRSEKDAYFDKNKTPGHILLARNLSIMLESLRLNPELQKEIDWDLIEELTDNSNETIQVLAVALIKDYSQIDADPENLYKVVDRYKGNAKADALSELSNNNSASERLMLVSSLEKAFAVDDPNTVISVVEKLKKMNLSQAEMAKVSRNLCHYKENGSDDPNWKMIKYDMGKVRIDLEKICTN